MTKFWHMTILLLLAIILVQGREDDARATEGASHQPPKREGRYSLSSLRHVSPEGASHGPPKPTDRYSLSYLRHVGSGVSESTQRVLTDFRSWLETNGRMIARESTAKFAAGKRQAEKGIHSVVDYSKRKYHYVYNAYRYARAARIYEEKMSQQNRKGLGHTTQTLLSLGMIGGAPQQALGAILAMRPSREDEIKGIARQAGLQLDEVNALALAIEGPVRSTQAFVSAVTEYPYEFSHFLYQYALYLWRCFGYGFWLIKLSAFSFIMLFACWHGNAKRAAFPLIMIGLCAFLANLPLASIMVIGCPIAVAWFWYVQPSGARERTEA